MGKITKLRALGKLDFLMGPSVKFVLAIIDSISEEQARKLQATLVRNYHSLTDSLAHGGEV